MNVDNDDNSLSLKGEEADNDDLASNHLSIDDNSDCSSAAEDSDLPETFTSITESAT